MKNLFLVVIAFFLFCSISEGQYLKIGDITGEATSKNYSGWSNIENFEHAIHTPKQSAATGAARRRGDVIVEDITIVKEIDSASGKIADALIKGQVYPLAEIAYEVNGQAYLKYELKNVLVSSYNISQSDGRAIEEIALNFEEIKVIYTIFDKTNKPTGKTEYVYKRE